ncbi:MAG: SGNH/GDSL hydrolase family protein [Planctomycetota bacterium]
MNADPGSDTASPAEPLADATRLVVLGASNVQLGLSTIMQTARGLAGRPVELLAALGHGRSYGRPSSIPGRTLPAVLDCRLWSDLADHPARGTASLITDIGNDLLYGRSPERVAGWIAECVDRLAERGPVTLTSLPTDNLPTLGEWRYVAFRTLFFPGLRLSLAKLTALAFELNERLHQIAAEKGVAVTRQPPEWYGFDPIHFRPRSRRVAWETLLGVAMQGSQARAAGGRPRPARLTLSERTRFSTGAAAERRLFGKDRQSKQPCLALGDGSSVSLY